MFVAKFRYMGEAALQAGNSETIIRRHYLDLKTPAEAEAFFGIMPQLRPSARRRSEQYLAAGDKIEREGGAFLRVVARLLLCLLAIAEFGDWRLMEIETLRGSVSGTVYCIKETPARFRKSSRQLHVFAAHALQNSLRRRCFFGHRPMIRYV